MSKNKELKNWEEVIVDFLNNKKEAKEEKYLKECLKEINDLYKSENYYNDQNLQDFFNAKKTKEDKNQTSLEFQQKKITNGF